MVLLGSIDGKIMPLTAFLVDTKDEARKRMEFRPLVR